MKKFFTLIVALMATATTTFAQMHGGAMTFAGKASFYVSNNGAKMGETAIESDTLLYNGADFTLPEMVYGKMVIPSFTIKGTKFEGGYTGVNWPEQTFTSTVTVDGQEKTITGSSLKGNFNHENGLYHVTLEVTFNYGTMPMPVTYSIDSYYVKDYAGENAVEVVGDKTYKQNVTYKIRRYMDGDVEKLDVAVPSYKLDNTTIGDLNIGGYTVKGLTMDDSKGGYYKEYAHDKLTMTFGASKNGVATMPVKEYELSKETSNNILVSFDAKNKAKIVNNFVPGAMPFNIVATLDQSTTTGISALKVNSQNGAAYNLNGQRVNGNVHGIVIQGGKKIFVK